MGRAIGKYQNLEQDEKIDTALDFIRVLTSRLSEAHQEELQTKHRGSSKAKGADPRHCPFCAAVRDADEFLDAADSWWLDHRNSL